MNGENCSMRWPAMSPSVSDVSMLSTASCRTNTSKNTGLGLWSTTPRSPTTRQAKSEAALSASSVPASARPMGVEHTVSPPMVQSAPLVVM